MLTILFYIRMTDKSEDEVIQILKRSIHYVLKTQLETHQYMVGTIYIEQWVFKLIDKDIKALTKKYCQFKKSMIQVWPYVHDIKTIGSDVNKLLQQRIDIVYSFGGDGTLLTLLKALYLNNDNVEIPQIAAFNMVSFKHSIILTCL